MKKRVLSLFMALALCLTLLPTAALAEENTTEPSTQLTEPTPVPQEPKTPDQGENTETPNQPEEPSQDEPPAADEQPGVQSEPAPQAAVQAAEVSAENAVAQVGNVNYANITDAFAAVKKNGGTLTLLANCQTPDTSKKFDISGNYTLDLNGCTLTGYLYLSETSTSLTVKDSSTNGKIQATGSWPALWADGGKVTIESGTLATETEKGQALVFGYKAACGTLTIKGGVFETGYVQIGDTGGTTVITGGAFHDLRVNGDYSKRVTLSGGTFDTVNRKNGSTIAPTDLLADGYAFVDRNTGAEVSTSQEAALTNVKVVSKETANASASLTVDGTETPYGTFEEALTAAQQPQGGTLTLLSNVNLVKQVYVDSGTFTLDLNGHTLTSADFNTMIVNGGSMTIQDSAGNGELGNNSKDDTAVWCGGGTVTVLSGSITSKLFWESGTVSLRGGAFRSLNRTAAGSWLSAIPEGKALERDGQITDASAKELITEDGFYVLADHEEHNWLEGRCACGREHTDHTWEDGKCTVCHLTCSHHEIGEDGMCKTCGTQFAVRDDDGNYYKHLADALAEPFVNDVTLVADDTLSTDVTLIKDIFFYPNGHTVSGGGAIVVPSGKTLVLNKAGNAGAIRVENGGTLMVDEGFTGTVQTLTVSEKADVKLRGGTYGTITGLRQKAGTLLYYNTASGEKHLAFQKQDGTFARYDQRISSETPLKNVTMVGCQDKQLTEACGETCEYCDGALRCRIGASGYRDVSYAIRDVPDGGTITLLRDYSAVYNISANTDHAYTIDLNGHSVRRNSDGTSLVVYAGTPKIIDSKGRGVIAGLEIDSKLDLTLADLLPEGWDFRNRDGSWISSLDLSRMKTASNVTVAQLPIQSMNYPTEMSMTYGGAGTLLVTVAKETGTGPVNFQWYKVEDGKETAVGGATTSNQFDLSTQRLSAGQHTFRFSATCDGYEKMSQDIVVTVGKADIRSGLITPPTARENLTYTGHEQALIIAGSVADYGTMQYSLTENGTYSQDIPTGTDAGAYTVWYRVIGDENHNDTAPASVVVRIGTKPLAITGVTAASKPYDGTTDAGVPSVTFDNVALNPGTDYTVTASFDDAGVGSDKNVTATVTLMEQAAKNYALEQSSFHTTGNITKAAAPDFTKATALVIVNGHEKTYTVTLPALPTLETPKEYGAPTYELGDIKLNAGYYTSGAKVENGALTLPIQKNDVETTGPVGTVTVVIKSTNYEDITLTVNVNATNKLVPTVTAPTANALTYNGTEQALVTAGQTTGGTMLYRLGDSEWSEHIPTAKNAGKYTVWYQVQGDAEYADVAEQSLTVSAAKKAVTVTALDKSAHTGSTAPDLSSPEADKNYKVEGLLGADTLSGTVTLTYAQTPDMSKPGKTAINIAGTLSNDNYEITYVPGTLTVSDRPSSGGGGSSSDRDTSSSGTVKTETTKNNDGSVTKTETKKDGTKVETTTGKDGSVTKTTTNPNGSSVTENKAADGSTGTVKTDKNGQTEANAKVSAKAVEAAKKSGEAVKAPVEVEASHNSNTAPTVKVELPGNAGKTEVEIPVSNAKPGTVAVLVHPDGTEEILKDSIPTEDGIRLTVDGSATVKIVDNAKGFIDTQNHWAKDEIDFVSARELVNGISATRYAPDASATRAQLWTILARQNDADLAGGSIWYEKAQNWAKEKGISDGANPNGTIHRAQMVTMLWRAMGQPAAGSAASFTDVPTGSYYAQAVAWAVENGITAGVGGGRFDPNATCTRAQIVTFLYRNYQSK